MDPKIIAIDNKEGNPHSLIIRLSTDCSEVQIRTTAGATITLTPLECHRLSIALGGVLRYLADVGEISPELAAL